MIGAVSRSKSITWPFPAARRCDIDRSGGSYQRRRLRGSKSMWLGRGEGGVTELSIQRPEERERGVEREREVGIIER